MNATNARLDDNEYKRCQHTKCNAPLTSGARVFIDFADDYSDLYFEAVFCDRECFEASDS